MKRRFLFLILLALTGFPLTSPAEEPDPAQTLVTAALADFEEKNFEAALTKLQEAEKLQPNSPFILNLLGAIYTKKKDYAAARTAFEEALEAAPNFFPAQFNLGELLFLQKQYPQALSNFTKMLNLDPTNELLQFKVILCLLLTEQPDEAKKLLSRMKYPINSPAKFYAEAAIKFIGGDKKIAAGLVIKGQTLFPEKASLYDETFGDLGWPIK